MTWEFEDDYILDPSHTERKRVMNETQEKMLEDEPNKQNYKIGI